MTQNVETKSVFTPIFYWKYFHFTLFGCAYENENAQIKPPIKAKHQSTDHHQIDTNPPATLLTTQEYPYPHQHIHQFHKQQILKIQNLKMLIQ